MNNTRDGLELQVFGFHHKLPVLISKMLEEMKNLSVKGIEEDLFGRIKQKVID